MTKKTEVPKIIPASVRKLTLRSTGMGVLTGLLHLCLAFSPVSAVENSTLRQENATNATVSQDGGFVRELPPFRGEQANAAELLRNATKDLYSNQLNATNATNLNWINPPPYMYSSLGKPDPFVPFLKPQSKPGDTRPGEKPASSGVTPSLSGVEAAQLKLSGIVNNPQDPSRSFALVELPDGKGMIVRQGMEVGMSGRISAITPTEIRIEETFKNVIGETQKRTVILKLKSRAGG